jgi:hypothetical protein
VMIEKRHERAVGHEWHNTIGLIGKEFEPAYPKKNHNYTKTDSLFAELIKSGDAADNGSFHDAVDYEAKLHRTATTCHGR